MPQITQLNARQRLDRGFYVRGQSPTPRPSPAPLKEHPKEEKTAPEEKRVRKIEAAAPEEKKKLKVAAYCRVSTMNEAQEGSIYAQRRHYEDLIRGNPEWELAGIYFEQGLSGTKAETRPELQRLLADCREGKVDLILTKSISRFSRNTSDTLAMVRGLTNLGVTIRFEKENIDTGTMRSEFMLSLLSCMAENESHSISNNGKWAIRKRFESGSYKPASAPYGYRKEGTDFIPVPEEADVVRGIFAAVLSGCGIGQIAADLNQRGIPTRNGGPWRDGTVYDILHNPTYTGDLLLQKTFVDETFTQRDNKGELDQYLHEEHHEPIIKRETFELAAQNMQQRGKEKNVGSGHHHYAFSGRLLCGNCGRVMKRVKRRGYFSYECSGCGAEPENNVKTAFMNCLNKLAFSQKQMPERRVLDVFINSISAAEKAGNKKRLEEIDAELEENQLKADVLTAVAMVNHFTPEQHAEKLSLLTRSETLRREKALMQTCATNTMKAESLRAFLLHWDSAEFPEEAFEEFVADATVRPGESVTFRFTCGLELREDLT